MEKQVHGVPALLSLFFPGLGQLVKGQWERAVLVWIVMYAPWGILAFKAGRITGTADLGENVLIMLQSPALPLVLLSMLIGWAWSVVDAYRRPANPHAGFAARPSPFRRDDQ